MKYFYTTNRLSENMHETQEGFLVCVGVPIARTGEMVYGESETPLVADDDGKVIVTRDEKEVFNPKTMASFEGKPITITHPTEFVSPDNWSRLAKGVIQNVRRGTGDAINDLIADLLITDSVAINLIKSGLREVSCGYEANYVQISDGEGKQTRIIGNHLALVDQGRAGSSYAINDHKGKGIEKMSLKQKISSIFAKATDEAMKIAEDAAGEKKDDMKKSDAKDEEKKDAPKKEDAKDGLNDESANHGLSVYDEVMSMCKDIMGKLESVVSKKDSADAEAEASKKEEPKKDDAKDEEISPSVEDRLKALEASVSKLLEMQAGDAKEDEDKKDEAKDEGNEADGEELESEDEDFEESTMTGDTASRVEILAPGMKADVKDAKAKALKTAYATVDGKKVIDSLTGGKPNFKSAPIVETLFVATSEVLKANRTSAFSESKKGSTVKDSNGSSLEAGAMTAEKLNELNAKFYNQA